MRDRFWEAWQSGKARPIDADVEKMEESQWTLLFQTSMQQDMYIYINIYVYTDISIHFDSFNSRHVFSTHQQHPKVAGSDGITRIQFEGITSRPLPWPSILFQKIAGFGDEAVGKGDRRK